MRHAVVLLAVLLFAGCTEEETTAPVTPAAVTVTDAQLYQLARTASNKAAYFNNSSDTIASNSGAAHAGKIVVWYNAVAKQQLTAQGRVKSDAVFADSSLIVKEIFTNAGARLYYAIMFKLSKAENKGAGDWVWAELNPDGTPFISASGKGQACGSCHSAGVAYTRMNDTHP